ncbi:MAG: lamin tail domain-containing protein [Bacteroidales bacterium]|nr:lamin tail domain-containing protein [Bacteroidales bacterium]
MRSIRILFSLSFLAAFCLIAMPRAAAQSGNDIRINEILVINDSNYIDDFGQRNAWIELFNTAYNKVDVGGMYLTNDPNNPTKYRIPKGDPITSIPARNYLIFFADNHTTRGILHLNFDLKDSDYLALYDMNGRTLIDEVRFPKLEVDKSYGRVTDGGSEWEVLHKTTPKSNNFTGEPRNPGLEFKEFDPFGIGMALIAMTVVFLALILLYLVFKNTRSFYGIKFSDLFKQKAVSGVKVEAQPDLTGEVNAAIALSLYLFRNELHDNEATVLTIKKVARTYSPWSSKIYGLRNFHK